MESSLLDRASLNDCWNQIGVMGDRSCGQLKTCIHCRNCPVYSAAGRSLLEREPPADYLEEWTNILAELPSELDRSTSGAIVRTSAAISIMIFRIGDEVLALPVKILQEVTSPCTIHTLPHRSNELFLGLVNIRGEILLCVSLRYFLGLEVSSSSSLAASSLNTNRMVVVAVGEHKWVFSADEIYGIYRFYPNEIAETPVVVTKAGEAYTKGVISWQNKKVNYLDSELLFYTLQQRIL